MLPTVCFTCGHLLADIQVPYEDDMAKIENNSNFTEQNKIEEKSKLLTKYCVDRYCCRTRVLGYVKLVEIII